MNTEPVWISCRPIHDAVIFADEDSPTFDRARAWRAVLSGMNNLDLDDVRIDALTTITVDSMGEQPIVEWSMRVPGAARLADRDRGV